MTSACPIRVGIIGVHPDKGWATTAHIPALRLLRDEYRLEAISHREGEVAEAAAMKFDVPRAFASSRELVRHPDVDLVVITVKVPMHRELITEAIEAGKAVASEWPLSVNLAEAKAIRDLAKTKKTRTSIGLQTRAMPVFSYARDLVRDGYVGDVLSATVIGSGILWGSAISESYAYTLDPASGAAMLNVPFAHTIDALLYVLDSPLEIVASLLGNSRRTIEVQESGLVRPLTVPDQIQVTGRLRTGAAVTAHFRGGLSRGTNFHLEINGAKGDLIITSPVGYVGIGGMTMSGAHGDEALHALNLPDAYDLYREAGASLAIRSTAIAYSRLASDVRAGADAKLSPTFDDAVKLHELIDAIERSNGRLARPSPAEYV